MSQAYHHAWCTRYVRDVRDTPTGHAEALSSYPCRPPQDLHRGNMIVKNSVLVVALDWEEAGVGDRRVDLMRWRGHSEV